MNYILYGNDESRMEQKIKALKSKYHLEQTIVFDANEAEQSDILNEMDSVSIFDENKMIVIRHADFLSSRDTTKYDLNAFVKRGNMDEKVIVVYCCSHEKLDKRKKLVKQLMALSTVYHCMKLDNRSRAEYVQEILTQRKVQMDADAFQWFVNRIGDDAMHIENEIEKLSIYNHHITLEDVKALVSPEPMHDIFKMVDALFDRNALLLLSYYRNFRQLNMEPVAIVALLASQIRFLFQVRVYMDNGMSKNQIVSFLHAHPYRVQLNMQKAQRFTAEELLEELNELAQFDQNMKRGFIDKDEGFEQFVLNMLTG